MTEVSTCARVDQGVELTWDMGHSRTNGLLSLPMTVNSLRVLSLRVLPADYDLSTHVTGSRFILPRSAALGSELVKNALEGGFSETDTNTVRLEEQRAEIVEKVAEYLMYKERYTNSKESVPDFKDRVKPETALELYVDLSFSHPPSLPTSTTDLLR